MGTIIPPIPSTRVKSYFFLRKLNFLVTVFRFTVVFNISAAIKGEAGIGKNTGFRILSASFIFAALANIAVSWDLWFLEYILEEAASGFMIPTFILFLRSNQANPQATEVFPISVSVPVINTPFSSSRATEDKCLFVDKRKFAII
jgi:hypothetical protein